MNDVPPDLLEPLIGCEVTEIRFFRMRDIEIVLEGSGERRISVRVGDGLELIGRDGLGERFDGDDATTAVPLLRLTNAVVAAADAAGGTLAIAFADGGSLRCEPNDRYEAWEIDGAFPYDLIVCTPGGELAYTDVRDPKIPLLDPDVDG